jgi:hypothetical protein
MELGSRPTIWVVAKGEGAVAPVVAARAAEKWVAAVVVQAKWVVAEAEANAIKVAVAKVAGR